MTVNPIQWVWHALFINFSNISRTLYWIELFQKWYFDVCYFLPYSNRYLILVRHFIFNANQLRAKCNQSILCICWYSHVEWFFSDFSPLNLFDCRQLMDNNSRHLFLFIHPIFHVNTPLAVDGRGQFFVICLKN